MKRRLTSPITWHYVSLALGLVIILILQAGQWFFFDEWAFLKLDGPGLFDPHVGHWSTSPLLVFEALRATVGLHSYYPYAAAVTIVHLALAHITWRVLLRSGANPWISTAMVTVLIFFGVGAENILWAFQIGFLGAMAIGLVAFFLASNEQVSRRRLVAIIAISLFSLTWSGTAIPIVAATFLVLLRSQGWRKAAIYLVANLTVYIAWYTRFAIGSPNNPDSGGFGLHKIFINIPEFLGVMLLFGWDKILPVPLLAFALLAAAVVWAIRSMVRTRSLDVVFPAITLAIAAIIFAVLTAFSRAVFSIGAAASSRYIYALFLLLLPLLAVALTRLVSHWSRGTVVACLLVGLIAGYQGVVLVQAAGQQSATEQRSNGLLAASLYLYVHHDTRLRMNIQPDYQNAPDIELDDLVALYQGGYISVGSFTPAELRLERTRLDAPQ
jgi:hypothetical protein